MTKKVVKNVKPICILVQAKRCKEALIIQWVSCKSTMGEYSIPAVSESPIMDVFPSGEEEDLKNRKV
jgi:hypothetical protein